MGKIITQVLDLTAETTPDPGNYIVALDLDGVLKMKDDTGTITVIGDGAGTSVPGYGTSRCVYLVQDASDATALGSTGNNVYTTFQTAYAAADSLQQSLGGTNKVLIMVGNTTAASVGDLTLTTNWNGLVSIVGISPQISELGNIIATNASGNGYNVGTIIGSTNQLRCQNVKIGSITTSPTGATGSAGSIVIVASNCSFGALVTSTPNTTNTNGGRVQFSSLGNFSAGVANSYVASINTSVPDGSAGSSGPITLVGSMVVPTVVSMPNTTTTSGAGQLAITGGIGGTIQISSLTWFNCGVNGNGMVIQNASISLVNAVAPSAVTVLDSSVSALTVNGTGTLAVTNSRIGSLTSEASMQSTIKHSFVGAIWGLGDDSVLVGVTLDGSAGTGNAVIDDIGTNCSLIGVNVYSNNPLSIKSLDSPLPVEVSVENCTFNAVVGSNISLKYKGGVPDLPDDGLGNFTFDADKSVCCAVVLGGLGGGSNNLTIRGVALGHTYRVFVNNTTGADTLNIVYGGAVVFANAAPYTPTATVGAVDILTITVGPLGDLYVSPTPLFQ